MSLKKLGRYDLTRVLGKGAMGIVYEGRDPNLDRRVAIKTVKVENLSEEAAAEYEHRFRTEARSAARLQHPNIVSVYDSDRDGDIAFLVMEYIQGDDLKHHLDRGVRYTLEQSLKMIRDLLSALDYAHKQGIVHRDIKPANMLIEPGGRVKLTDFGVARIQDSGEATRTQGSMVGTLKYMSPEQVQGQKIDSRADLFSVGVVLYQLLTDKRPFDGDNDFSIIHQIIGHTPPPPSSVNPRLPSAIDAVVARALAKDREQRFATARDFASALQSAIRRAEDATVVPPADPGKKTDAAATNSRTGVSVPGAASATSPSRTNTSTTATVAQELELVYWKDIKDSADPEELEGFLQRFPEGIYADLARRRLRRLMGGTDATVPPGGSLPGVAEPDLDATRMRGEPVRLPEPQDFSPTAIAETQDFAPTAIGETQDFAPTAIGETTDFTQTVVEPYQEVPPAIADPSPGGAAPAARPAIEAPVARARRHKSEAGAAGAAKADRPPRSKGWLAGAGIVAIAGLVAAAIFVARSPKPAGGAAAPLAAASAPAPEPAASAAAASPAESTPVQAAAVVAAAAPVASQPAPAPVAAPAAAASRPVTATPPRPAPSSRRGTPAATTAATAPAASPAAAPSEPRPEPRPAAVAAATPASRPQLTPPGETCKDKVFLAKQFCLHEECAKPVFFNNPACVRMREEARLREESKVRN